MKEEKQSQCKLILDHLNRFGSITPITALTSYGCMRLGARILDLKQKGHNIIGHKVTRNSKSFSEYTLVKG